MHLQIALIMRSMMMLLLLLIVTVLCSTSRVEAGLQVGFYDYKCPFAEAIVKKEVTLAFLHNKGFAPGLVRMHFHDCFVRGCDASILLDSTKSNLAEKDAQPNQSVRGFEVIYKAKSKLEAACPGVVSCADIIAFAARDSSVLTGGLYWAVPAGRRDGRVSIASETSDIPSPDFDLPQITQSFAKKRLSQDDMTALLGAHTIGRSHCDSISDRLYNYSTFSQQDPSLNPALAQFLKKKCPRDDPNDVVFMNQTPIYLDSSYYANVLQHAGLFTSDQALLHSLKTANQVAFYATHDFVWQNDFVQAMIKMSSIDVLTGDEGEVRANCRVVNSDHY